MPEPEVIATELLQRTGQALTLGDATAFRDCFHLPQSVATDLGAKMLTTEQEIGETFGRVRWHFRGLRLTEMQRSVLGAMFVDCDTLVSVHQTHLLRSGAPVQQPFRVLSTLSRQEGDWKIVDTCYAIHDSLRHSRALFGPGTPVGMAATG